MELLDVSRRKATIIFPNIVNTLCARGEISIIKAVRQNRGTVIIEKMLHAQSLENSRGLAELHQLNKE